MATRPGRLRKTCNVDDFFRTVYASSRPALDQVLANNPSLDVRDSKGFSLLHRAVQEEDRGKLVDLIKAGAHVNSQDHSGNTPLHLAANRLLPGFVRVLIEHRGRLNVANSQGDVPAMAAVYSHLKHDFPQRQDEVVDVILEAYGRAKSEHFPPPTQPEHCSHALVLHAAERLCPVSREKALDTLQALGANIDAPRLGLTPLNYALRRNNIEAVQILLKRGANPNTEVPFPKAGSLAGVVTHLFSRPDPARAEFYKLGLEALLLHGTHPDGVGFGRDSHPPPVCIAAFLAFPSCVKLLIQYNCALWWKPYKASLLHFNFLGEAPPYIRVERFCSPLPFTLITPHYLSIVPILLKGGLLLAKENSSSKKVLRIRMEQNEGLKALVLDYKAKLPLSLKELSRLGIRKVLKYPIHLKVDHTGLPVLLQQYLMFSDIEYC